VNTKCFIFTVTSKVIRTSESIEELIIYNIYSTVINVGINAFKILINWRVLLETNPKEEMDKLSKNINANCGDNLETRIHKSRNSRLVIINIPKKHHN